MTSAASVAGTWTVAVELGGMATSRIGGLIEHRENQIIPPDVTQILHQEIGPQHAGVEMPLVLLENVRLQLLQYGWA